VTLSLAGRCARTGQLGVVISSSSPAVAARCAHARAGSGAACSQNITDPRLGARLLDLMAAGKSAPEAIDDVVRTEQLIAFRQLTAIDAAGRTGAFSGEQTLGQHAAAWGVDCVAAGNLLAGLGVPSAMIAAFELDPEAEIEERLLAAYRAGLAAGGEVGPVHSAGIVVAADVPWYVTDLRVDWSDDPLRDLEALWAIWAPQKADYLRRALDPCSAPSYGVPGDPTTR
jgi:uncharacterized Ntn-hydrolase superfamily protein